MKKALLVALLALGLVACGKKEAEKVEEAATQVEQAVEAATEETVLTFAKENEEGEVTLKSADLFDTAILTVGDAEYQLKAVPAGSGMQLASEDEKVSIHVKEGEGGILTIDGVETNLIAK